MRLIFPVLLALAAAVAVPPSARAQESDEALKKRIMDQIKEELAKKHKDILEKVSKAIDEELSGKAKPETKPEPAPTPKAGEPKSADKRVKDLERKLKALDDQREDILRDIRGIKREVEDADIIEDATKSGPQTRLEASDEFKSYFDTHEAATKLLKTDRDQAVKKFEKSIAGFKRLFYALRKADPDVARGMGVPSAYNVACGYALIGQNEKAIDWLEASIKAGYDDFDHMRADTDLDGLRKERRYLRLLADR
ncbi:MAG TPA: hypothetical protein VK661_01965 [Planctomycetota bacterium]|jgi:hypothetical protein|nr:hypothetical protein [Planctomycetota bacterium]